MPFDPKAVEAERQKIRSRNSIPNDGLDNSPDSAPMIATSDFSKRRAERIASEPPRELAEEQEQPNPDMLTRFSAGMAGKEIPQPEGFDVGDIAQFTGRYGPAMFGAARGAPLGPLGMFGGAVTGEMGRLATAEGISAGERLAEIPEEERMIGKRPSTRDKLLEAGITGAQFGAAGAGGEGIGLGVEAVASTKLGQVIARGGTAIKDGLSSAYADLNKVFNGVSTRLTKRILKNPKAMQGPSVAEAGASQARLVESKGFKSGLEAQQLVTGDEIVQANRAITRFNRGLRKLKDGKLTVQEAIVIRQLMSRELARPKFQNTLNKLEERSIILGLQKMDAMVEKAVPGFGAAVSKTADAYAKEAFGKWLPQNVSTTPSVLRGGAATAATAAGFASGNPLLGIAGASLTSPMIGSLPLRLAGRLAGSGATAATAGTVKGLEALQQAFEKHRSNRKK